MAITLPKKIFGRDAEGGIERALARAAETASNPSVAPTNDTAAATTATAPLSGSVQTYTSHPDWSKFLDPAKVYEARLIEHYGKSIFINTLWKKCNKGKKMLRAKDIADFLLEYKASDHSNVNTHVVAVTDEKAEYPGIKGFFCSHSSRFSRHTNPSGKEQLYQIDRYSEPDY
jgi:hypothetical protein